jgi:hypothetical protein
MSGNTKNIQPPKKGLMAGRGAGRMSEDIGRVFGRGGEGIQSIVPHKSRLPENVPQETKRELPLVAIFIF